MLSTQDCFLSINLFLIDLVQSPPVYHSDDYVGQPVQLEDLPIYATPVSTPLSMSHAADNYPTPAPNVSTPKSTDTFDSDPTARLIDITDETWGLLANQFIYFQTNGTVRQPALASGYLIKRRGPKEYDGWIMLGVRILSGSGRIQTVLRDLLVIYRSFGTLARFKMVEDPVNSILPWHVAVARKSQLRLSAIIGYAPG